MEKEEKRARLINVLYSLYSLEKLNLESFSEIMELKHFSQFKWEKEKINYFWSLFEPINDDLFNNLLKMEVVTTDYNDDFFEIEDIGLFPTKDRLIEVFQTPIETLMILFGESVFLETKRGNEEAVRDSWSVFAPYFLIAIRKQKKISFSLN